MIEIILGIIISYLIGSIPASYLVGKYYGHIDIRNYGSGNSGATNVLRTLGKKAAIIAFFGDFMKGFIISIIGKNFFGLEFSIICSVSVVIGHCYSFFLNFKGGKGVATTGGTIFALNPAIGFILLAIQIIITLSTRIMSLASLIVALSFPVLSLLLKTENSFVVYAFITSLFVIYKHRSNIKRLLNGTESRLSFKK